MLKLMGLLIVANGAPILMTWLLGQRLNWPVDGGRLWPRDGRRVLGRDKSWRGVVASLLAAGLAAEWLGWTGGFGFTIAAWAMLGDLVSSFCKRRLGLAPGDRALGLDQIPESLFPLLAARAELDLRAGEVAELLVLFLCLDLILSRGLYALHIRERPY